MKNKVFYMNLDDLVPSQLYLNEEKIRSLQEKISPFTLENIPPISIRKFNDKIVFLDGHTRAYLAYKNRLTQIPVYWETEEYDWELYEICINWCVEKKILHIKDLHQRIVDKATYEKVWIDRCQNLHNEIEQGKFQYPPKP